MIRAAEKRLITGPHGLSAGLARIASPGNLCHAMGGWGGASATPQRVWGLTSFDPSHPHIQGTCAMRCWRSMVFVLILAAIVLLGVAVRPAGAIGYWNLPGNVCQFVGCGYGPGYHAPMVLGPNQCNGCLSLHEVRLPYTPRPPYEACGSCQCATCACGCEAALPAAQVQPPTVVPVTMPAPATKSQSFAPPAYHQPIFPAFAAPPLQRH